MFGQDSLFQGIDLKDPKAIVDSIVTFIQSDTESARWFNLAMKQHLMVPQDSRRRSKYYQLFYLLIKEIMIQGHGSVIDVSKFKMNMDVVLEELFSRDNFDEVQKMSKEIEKQLALHVKTTNQLQDTVTFKESVIQKQEDELAALKKEVSELGSQISSTLEKRKEFTSSERLDIIKRISTIETNKPLKPSKPFLAI